MLRLAVAAHVLAIACARSRLEPVRRIVHAGGQENTAFANYSGYLGSAGPSTWMAYCDMDGLNRTQPGTVAAFFVQLNESLSAAAGADDAFIVLQLGLQLPLNGSEARVAAGDYDVAIEALRFSLVWLSRPTILRIGYEFNGPWNAYRPSSYVGAYRRIAAALHGDATLNASVALVWDGSCDTTVDPTPFFPGSDVVDWEGINVFTEGSSPAHTSQGSCLWYWLTDCAKAGLPLMLGEMTPRGMTTSQGSVWDAWFGPLADLLTQWGGDAGGPVKLISYIDQDWDAFARWHGWGDSRVEARGAQSANGGSDVGPRWAALVSQPRFIARSNRSTIMEALGVPMKL